MLLLEYYDQIHCKLKFCFIIFNDIHIWIKLHNSWSLCLFHFFIVFTLHFLKKQNFSSTSPSWQRVMSWHFRVRVLSPAPQLLLQELHSDQRPYPIKEKRKESIVNFKILYCTIWNISNVKNLKLPPLGLKSSSSNIKSSRFLRKCLFRRILFWFI